MCRLILAMMVMSNFALAQHAGHEQHPQSSPSTQAPAGAVLTVRDAIKASQALFRDLEKAARSGDESHYSELASRYESTIDDLMNSIDSAQGGSSYAKDLDLAQRSLHRQLDQIERLADGAPAFVAAWRPRLSDAVALARDETLSQQEAARAELMNRGSEAHAGMSHGCGSGRRIPPQ